MGRTGPTLAPAARRSGLLLAAALLVVSLLPVSTAVGSLTNLSVFAGSQRAGESETWTVQFGSPSAGPAASNRLAWTLPPGFLVENPVCSLAGASGVTVSVSGQTVTCTIGAGSYAIGQTMTWTITNVRSPSYAQTTPTFHTEYQNNAGVPIASDDSATATILPNFLNAVSASLVDAHTGVVTTLNLQFTPKNLVGANGDVRFVLPSSFDLQNNAACAIAGLSGLTLTRVSSTEGVCNLNSATLVAGTAYTLVVSGVKNALYGQSYQLPILQTRTATDALQDTAANILLSLDARHFAGTPKATPASDVAGAITSWVFEATLSNPLPAGDFVSITFPAGFKFNQGATTIFDVVSGTTGHFATPMVSGQRIYAKLADGISLGEGTTLKIRLPNIQNPSTLPQPLPDGSQIVTLVLTLLNSLNDQVANVKDFVGSLLHPCNPEAADCCATDPTDCDPACDSKVTSESCCRANNNCPPPPSCDPLQPCPTSKITAAPTSSGGPDGPGSSGGDPNHPGTGDHTPGHAVYKFFSGAGPLGRLGSILGAVLGIVVLGSLGAGGYAAYRAHAKAKPKAGTKVSKSPAPGIPKKKD